MAAPAEASGGGGGRAWGGGGWGSGFMCKGSVEEGVSACVAKVWWGEGAKGGRGAGGGDA